MILKTAPPEHLQAVASAANFKPGLLKAFAGDLDIEIREDAATQSKCAVVLTGGAETPLRDHLAALEDGAEILGALDAGAAPPGVETAALENWSARRYGHNAPPGALPQDARVDTQDVPASHAGNGIPAQGGVQGTGTPHPLAGLDNFAQNRYGHNLPPKGNK